VSYRGKRWLDLVLVGGTAPVWLPILAVTALVVRVKLGSPILFRQQRPGLNGRPFSLLKFRTMTDARSPDGMLLPDADRLSPFGRALRGTSLDELPELINVLCGDMSLVGPRPLLMRYLPRYSAYQNRRHEVRPGLTGLAQVSGRNALSWEERLDLDVAYVQTASLALDVRIITRTILAVLRQDGINAAGEATMSEFNGSGAPPGSAL
jgi:lipopolysaccharide/colanic/teichoic acid biosynthesis glycosyltransferase